MKLLKKLRSKKKKSEKYITIVLSERTVIASLWMINGKVQILESSPIIPLSGSNKSLADIDKCLQELGEASEGVKKVVLCLNESWVKNDALSTGRKPFLKDITKQLFLNPVGFVTIIEALHNAWKKTSENSSAIEVFLEETILHLKLVRENKIISEYSMDSSGDFVADLTEGIARLSSNFKEGVKLPSKIILISISHLPSEMEEKSQSLMTIDWSSQFSFIKDPLIEWLSQEKLLEIVTKESSKVLQSQKEEGGSDDRDDNKREEKKESSEDYGSDLKDSYQAPKNEIAVDDSLLPHRRNIQGGVPENKNASQFDFVNQIPNQSTSFGIPVKNDYFSDSSKTNFDKNELSFHEIGKKKKKRTGLAVYLRSMTVGLFFGILILLGILYLYLKSSYRVLIQIKPHVVALSKEVVLTLNPEAETSLEDLVLQATIVDKEIVGEKTAEATGKDKIGEKAAGEVTIYNKTDKKKKFEKGTTITKDDLEFSLSDDVEVDEVSIEETDDGEVKQYGKATVAVSAKQIGEESNLSKGVVLKVDGYSSSSYSASVKENFSGGSSEEITVVSEEDRVNLLAEVKGELIEQAKTKFQEESGQGHYLIPTNDSEIISANYDEEVGAKVDAFTLNLTLKVKAISYLSKDLVPLSKFVLTSELPEGYSLSEKKPAILASPKEEENEASNHVELIVNISANGVAQIDLNEIQNSVIGKESEEIKNSLISNEKIDGVVVEVNPGIVSRLFSQIPDNNDRIKIELVNNNED